MNLKLKITYLFGCAALLMFPGVGWAQSETEVQSWIEAVKTNNPAEFGAASQKLVLAGPRSAGPLLEAVKTTTDLDQKSALLRAIGNLGVAAGPVLSELKAMRLALPESLLSMGTQAIREIEAFQDCGIPKAPADAKVFFAGGYSGLGDTPINVRLGGNDHEVHQTDIVVTETESPVILVLGSYDPVVWKIGRLKNARIAGVLVFGYEPQAVIGIEKSVALRIYSTTQKNSNCPRIQVSYNEPDIAAEMDIVRLTGLPLTRTLRQGSGKVVVGPEESVSEQEIVYSNDLPLKKYGSVSDVPAGQAGIEYLVKKGKLRAVTEKDWKGWEAAAPKTSAEAFANLKLSGAYLVLGKTEFPPGLFGANSKNFVIQKKVPRPTGNPGHSQCLLLEDFSVGFCSR